MRGHDLLGWVERLSSPGEPAGTRYELHDPQPFRPSRRAWLRWLADSLTFRGASLQVPSRKTNHLVQDRLSGSIVYQVQTWGQIDGDEAVRLLSGDLLNLTVDEFQREYGLRPGRSTPS